MSLSAPRSALPIISLLCELTSRGPHGRGQGERLRELFHFPRLVIFFFFFRLMNLCPCACIVTPRAFLQTKVSAGRGDEGGRQGAALPDTSVTAHLPPLGAHAVRLRSCPATPRGCASDKPCASHRALQPRRRLGGRTPAA